MAVLLSNFKDEVQDCILRIKGLPCEASAQLLVVDDTHELEPVPLQWDGKTAVIPLPSHTVALIKLSQVISG